MLCLTSAAADPQAPPFERRFAGLRAAEPGVRPSLGDNVQRVLWRYPLQPPLRPSLVLFLRALCFGVGKYTTRRA